MTSFTDLIASRRESGLGVGASLSGGLREFVKEKMDPRRFLNQSGLLVALFPKLKTYQAKKESDKRKILSSEPTNNFNSATLETIKQDTSVTAKNFLVLPSMARDVFLIKENIAKLIKLKGGKPADSAKEWASRQAARESAYESKFGKKNIEEKIEKLKEKSSFLGKMLGMIGVGLGLSMFSGTASANMNRSPGVSGGGVTFNQLSKEQQEKLMDAQYKVESGGKSNSLATRLNNPGAMKYTGSEWQKKYGATRDESGFARFPSMEQGRAAQRHLWGIKGDMPIESAAESWSGAKGVELQNYTGALLSAAGVSSTSPEGSITGRFGEQRPGHLHAGIDIKASTGTPVHSVEGGVVTRSDSNDAFGYGNLVEVQHENGYKTRYAHLNSRNVKVGQQVNAGDIIGSVGSTGRSSGPHLHYEVRKGDRAIDPDTFKVSQKPIDYSPALQPGQTKLAKTNEITATSPVVAAANEPTVRDKDVIIKENNVNSSTPTSGGLVGADTTQLGFDFVFNRSTT